MTSSMSSVYAKTLSDRFQYTRNSTSSADRVVKLNEVYKIQKSAAETTTATATTRINKLSSKDPCQTTTDSTQQELEILRQFDVDAKYGPCTGLSRLERWNRADKFGFNPPAYIREVVLKHPTDNRYTQCVWYGVNI